MAHREAHWAAAMLLVCVLAAGCKGQEPSLATVATPHQTQLATGPPTYVGRWATTPTDCAHAAWVLTENEMRSAGALSCSFVKVEPSSAGYTAWSSCTSGRATGPTRLVFTLSGPGRDKGLTVEGGPLAEPVALERCEGAQTEPVSQP